MSDIAIPWLAAVFIFGAGVGASELIARYKDAPFGAARSAAAGWYIFVNATAAAAAYILIIKFDFFAGANHKEWIEFLVAVFGSMAFFSKFALYDEGRRS